MAADRMSDGAVHHTRIFDTPEALAGHVADWIIECAREAPRRFAICLSGGSTPKRLYGHIASLFPGSPALKERERWAVPVVGENPLDRISLTYPALASSELTAFLVAGQRKRDVLARVGASDAALPASRLSPDGAVYWFADRAAAAAPVFSGE
jgi:6-phosphogluconolactonase/glucosamine-6-phosphate isomerase/deaminase